MLVTKKVGEELELMELVLTDSGLTDQEKLETISKILKRMK